MKYIILEKARTIGAKDLKPRMRRYKVTLVDGHKIIVEAPHPMAAVQIARTQHKLTVQRVEYLEKGDYVILEKSDKYFSVDRADDCVWLTDLRGKKRIIHLTKEQAKKVGKDLINISKCVILEKYFSLPDDLFKSGFLGTMLKGKLPIKKVVKVVKKPGYEIRHD